MAENAGFHAKRLNFFTLPDHVSPEFDHNITYEDVLTAFDAGYRDGQQEELAVRQQLDTRYDRLRLIWFLGTLGMSAASFLGGYILGGL